MFVVGDYYVGFLMGLYFIGEYLYYFVVLGVVEVGGGFVG